MADYIYLIQTRLTAAQQAALTAVRDVARAKGMTVFLVGGAVRDLTNGSPVRDLDVVVQGNALKLKKDLEKLKLTYVGESVANQALYFATPGGVRLEVGSTLSITYPKPGKPVAKPATILDDLRRRDFTANAMAISLNDGSYGLLMDPLNGVADIENRELRMVSPYGFIEDPVRMIRAVRLGARLGYQMEEKTQQRYTTAKSEGYISALNPEAKAYETEEIFHEEDPLRVLRRLEAEGWAKSLHPAVMSSKANENELNKLRDTASQLEAMGIFADPSAAYFPLLTAKMVPKDITALKKLFPRQGFVEQIAKLDADTKDFTTKFTNKAVSSPSETWKLLMSSVPEHVLSLAHSSKSAPVQARFQAFFHESAQARQRIPYQTLQEMRITPDLPIYNQLIEDIFFAMMDKKLETPEAIKAFLEPFSPPAPPPPVNMRRRAVKRETKPTKRSKKVALQAEASAENATDATAPAVPLPTAAESAKPAKSSPAKPSAPAKAVVAAPPAAPAKQAAPKNAATKPPAKVIPAKAPAKKAAPAPAKKSTQPSPAKGQANKVAAKKVAAKKTAPKKIVKPAVKKLPAKPAPKKAVTKAKTSAQKVVAKKSVPKKAAAPKKTVAPKKSPAKKTVAKNSPAKKAAAKKRR